MLAFVTGYASIAWLLRYLVDHSVTVFVVYRVALGILVLALVAAGTIDATPPALGDYLSTVGLTTAPTDPDNRRIEVGRAAASARIPTRAPEGRWSSPASDAGDGDVADDEADAGGAHRQPLDVGADRHARP